MIRPVRRTDAAAWHALRRALWPAAGDDEHVLAIERFFWAPSDAHTCLVAEEGSTLVGMLELSIRAHAEGCASDRVGYLEGWYVVPAWRQRGIGRALVAAGERWARERRCHEFASDSGLHDTAVQAVHRARGFAEVDRIVCYRKALSGLALGLASAGPGS